MRKKALIGLAIFAMTALMAAGVWAWFTAEAAPVENTFTAGTVEIRLVDDFDGDELAGNWNPGQCIDKKIYVENLGTKCVYVRVKLESEWSGVADEEGNIPVLSTDNVQYRHYDGTNWKSGVSDDWWYDQASGWYYYKEQLPGFDGSTPVATSHLIDEVCLEGPATGNEYQGATLKIKVSAEAIQCAHGAIESNEGGGWNFDPGAWEDDL